MRNEKDEVDIQESGKEKGKGIEGSSSIIADKEHLHFDRKGKEKEGPFYLDHSQYDSDSDTSNDEKIRKLRKKYKGLNRVDQNP